MLPVRMHIYTKGALLLSTATPSQSLGEATFPGYLGPLHIPGVLASAYRKDPLLTEHPFFSNEIVSML